MVVIRLARPVASLRRVARDRNDRGELIAGETASGGPRLQSTATLYSALAAVVASPSSDFTFTVLVRCSRMRE